MQMIYKLCGSEITDVIGKYIHNKKNLEDGTYDIEITYKLDHNNVIIACEADMIRKGDKNV